jgi:DNA-binding MarR family transcriptional regulator
LSSDLTDRPEYPLDPPLIGALLRMPVDAIRTRMLAGLHEAGFDDLVPAHLIVLAYPGPENRRPSDLASQARMTKQAMNYLLGEMQRLGYLKREPDPQDHRSKRVRLTRRGDAAGQTIRQIVGQIETELEQELGPERFGPLRTLLIALNKASLISNHNQ